jgi:hypothetical protein
MEPGKTATNAAGYFLKWANCGDDIMSRITSTDGVRTPAVIPSIPFAAGVCGLRPEYDGRIGRLEVQ